ncbi:oligosaccharide flippase family protein [Priestia megaterium]|uniref:oligosaccharide flippase family protein n=1 Tax=Priestia megaterium TaxID=1404 RepID=UPI000470A7C9|nr:oligosaccharide flippase family protein [Priestia megaterium]
MSKGNYFSSILKNIRINFMRNILISALTFISSIVYARSLGPDLYGDYTYATWLISTAAVILALGVPGTITKFTPEYYYNEKYEHMYNFYRAINRFFILWGATIIIIAIVTSKYWGSYNNLTSENKVLLLSLSSVAVLPTILNILNTNFIQAVRAFDYYAKVNIVCQLLTILLNVLIVITLKNILLMVTVICFFNFIQYILYSHYMKKLIPEHFMIRKSLRDKKRILNYSGTMYINILWQQVVWTRSEFFFLGIYANSKDISIYGVAYSLISIVNMIFTPIMNVLVNYFSELVSKNKKEVLNLLIFYTTKYFNLFLIPFFFAIVLFYKPILMLIYSSSYRGVLDIFPLLLLSTLFSVVMSVGNSIPFYYEKQRSIIIIGIMVGVLNILLDIFLIPKYTYFGAALANVISQFVFTIISFLYNIKVFNIKYPIKFIIVSAFIGGVIFAPGFLVENISFRVIYAGFSIPTYFIILYLTKLFDENDKSNIRKVIKFIKRK